MSEAALSRLKKGQRTKADILNKAMKHSSQYGLADISIGTMAKLCSLSRSGVIAHFKHKQDMQLAIIRHTERQFIKQVLRPARCDNGLQHLRNIMVLWHGWAQQLYGEANLSCPMLKANLEFQNHPNSTIALALKQQQGRLLQYLGDQIKSGITQGHINKNIHSDAAAFDVYRFYVGHTILSPAIDPATADEYYQQGLNKLIQALHSSKL